MGHQTSAHCISVPGLELTHGDNLLGPWRYARSLRDPSSLPRTILDRSSTPDLQSCHLPEPALLNISQITLQPRPRPRKKEFTSQAKFRVHSEPVDAFSERVGGYDVYFVEEQEPPFSRSDPLHHFFGVVRSFTSDSNHRVGRNDDSGGAGKLNVSSSLIQIEEERELTISLLDWVKVQICLSEILENWRNCCFH